MFIVTVNVIGIIPYTFTVTSHIIITIALALLVFLTVVVYGLYKHGLHFLKLFVPSGIPIYILPLVVFIEVLAFWASSAHSRRSPCPRRSPRSSCWSHSCRPTLPPPAHAPTSTTALTP